MVAQSIKDADTFFGVELPSLPVWTFGPEQAAAIHQPVLSVLGAETQPLWVEIAAFLRSSLPHVEDCTIDRAGHLLQIQRPEPVARAIAEFLARNDMAGRRTTDSAGDGHSISERNPLTAQGGDQNIGSPASLSTMLPLTPR